MRRLFGILCLLLLLPVPAQALVYDPASYTDDGVVVNVSLDASPSWTAMYAEDVAVNLSVVPLGTGLLEINITRVTVIVNRADSGSSQYSLIADDEKTGTLLATGTSYANYTGVFELSAQMSGLECYFALIVAGSYHNSTGAYYFQAVSQENLIGPFSVGSSILTPTNIVGLVIIGLSFVVCIAGAFGVKRSRTRVRRKSLMDE